MTTVKVKFRESTVKGRNGVIYYQLCRGRSNKQITTKYRISPNQWNEEKSQIDLTSEQCSHLAYYQKRIDNDVMTLKRIINDFDGRKVDYNLSAVIDLFLSQSNGVSVFSFFKEQISMLIRNKKLSTARNYQRSYNSFSTFLGGRDILFSMVDESLVTEYNDWLELRNVVRNTISFYMRALRSVYNKAVRQNLVEQTFPFTNVYTGVDRTRKRAVEESVIEQLQKLDLKYSPSLRLARDLFVFSFCTRGMAFIDVAFLRKEDINHGFISYARHKTGQRLTIFIEPCIEEIIDRYQEVVASSPYIFPIISNNNPEKAFRQYQTALGYYNRKLKKLGTIVGASLSITSYTSRHTWATTARNHNVPISVISAGMGHTSEKTTQIYLSSLENSIIDKANKDILKTLNDGVSKQETLHPFAKLVYETI